jgi:hypothetical protein
MTATLERRYRRLLACYPAAHRGTYGDEMIGVLLASARPGQRRPKVADTLDLFSGGLRVRLHRLATGTPDPAWRNALALTTVIAPILLALTVTVTGQALAPLAWSGSAHQLVYAFALLVPALLALAGLRWVAVGAAALTLGGTIAHAAGTAMIGIPAYSAFIVLLGVQTFALWYSAGPRQGLRLVKPVGLLIAIPWLLTTAYLASLIPRHYPVPVVIAEVGVGLIALAGLPALASPCGRRLLLLNVVIPLSGLVITILSFVHVDFYELRFTAALAAQYLPPAALSALTYYLIRRAERRPPELEVAR